MCKTSHRPDGNIADVLASTHTCTTAADASVNYSGYAAKTLKTSHRPHGKLKICSLFAGRRCLRLFRHGHDNVFLNLREYSYLCARSFSKVPIASMGKLLMCLPRLTLKRLHNCGPHSGQLQAVYVPQRPEISQRPDGNIADVLISNLTCYLHNCG